MKTSPHATIDDLYRLPEDRKAEVVGGQIVFMSPTGALPGRAATAIAASLKAHERSQGGGYAFGDNVGFHVRLPGRESFSPDAAWYVGAVKGMDFLEGAPAFAAEVRSKEDYGPRAEEALARKRADYFAAGTLVVWDVDLLGADVVRVYRSGRAEPMIYRRGEVAEAEPAVPGWRLSVVELFE